jgi:hypothetical protein
VTDNSTDSSILSAGGLMASVTAIEGGGAIDMLGDIRLYGINFGSKSDGYTG